MDIHHFEEGSKGYFKAVENEAEAGRISYSRINANQFIIDHTEVNPDFSGRGVGKKLIMEAVTYARKNNQQIMPLCPFAKSVFDKTEAIQDVLFH